MKKIVLIVLIMVMMCSSLNVRAAVKKSNTLYVTDNMIQVGFAYGSKYMLLDYKKCGVNSLMALAKVSIKGQAVLLKVSTDWIGPYKVRANSLGNKNKSAFTGGWHGYNGNGTGTPTAKTISYEVYADNKKVKKYQLINCNEIKIKVVNLVQGYNTKVYNGKGRYILKESIEYKINYSNINVSAEVKALEEVTIERYYGLQTQNNVWRDKIEYCKLAVAGVYKYSNFSGYKYSESNDKIQKYILKSSNNVLTAWLDTNVGLGKRQYVSKDNPYAFTETYGKSYFNLVNGLAAKMKKNGIFNWVGGYKFSTVSNVKI